MNGKLSCEICGDGRESRRHDLGARTVILCGSHGALARGAATLDELRRLFPEVDGRRSLLGRRAGDERREFPPRPEGRRHDAGRRTSDDA